MALRVAIHQPNYLPWGGYFSKMMYSDVFVFLDDAQFSKNSFINRNRVKGPGGPRWLTVPVHGSVQKAIREIEPAGHRWVEKHIKTLDYLYRLAPYYETYRTGLIESLRMPFTTVAQLNMHLVLTLANWMNISCKFLKSSDLAISSVGDDRIIEIVKKVDGAVYVSGRGAMAYQNRQKFTDANIVLRYLDYRQLPYQQSWGVFEPNLSIIDLLFNVGTKAKELVVQSGQFVPHSLT